MIKIGGAGLQHPAPFSKLNPLYGPNAPKSRVLFEPLPHLFVELLGFTPGNAQSLPFIAGVVAS